ncbi:rhodanese-like domain-containing protein, partial [Paenarthrobacter nicotinovorans]|uniref:rhodanese-like domain-containing protein n=1 Tax=Paenarthrobacter nicotinovorans TaxID=29320 RepID=UPI0024864EB7
MSIETTVQDSVQEDTQLITADAAAKLIEEGALLIDVRSEGGRASTGAVPGAVVVNREHVEEDFSPESAHRLAQVSGTDQKIVVFCGSVNGSRPVAQKLNVLGYAYAVHVDGGFTAHVSYTYLRAHETLAQTSYAAICWKKNLADTLLLT